MERLSFKRIFALDKMGNDLTPRQKALLLGVLFVLSFIFFYFLQPPVRDWHDYFYPVSKIPFKPYTERFFLNAPWAALILYPLGLFPQEIGWILNASLNVVVFSALILQRNGSTLSLLLTLTSLPMVYLGGSGNIEWLPALGFIFPNAIGIILLGIKPQNGILAGIDWFYRQEKKWQFILIPAGWVLLSLLIWWIWPLDFLRNLEHVSSQGMAEWNLSLFPWSVPVGLGLIYYIIKKKPANGELWGTMATYCLVPYFTGHSLMILFTLLSIAYPRKTILVWIASWTVFFLTLS